MESISLQYPAWYLILCFALGALYALVLYYRRRSAAGEREFGESRPLRPWLLGALRFLGVSLLAILLLSPLLKTVQTEVRKPLVLLAQDASQSIARQWEDADDSLAYAAALDSLYGALSERYELEAYSFGEEVRPGLPDTFADKATDIAAVLHTFLERYAHRNPGAVLLLTDGIYNRGSNPLYATGDLKAPFFTVGLGDTVPPRDLLIKAAFYNRIAYLGDRFKVQVDVAARHLAGRQSELRVMRNGQVLQRRSVQIGRDDFFQTIELELPADRAGVQAYQLVLSPLEGELSTENNRRDFFVEVLDAREKILLLAAAPHPDIAAFRQILSNAKNYELTVAFYDDLHVKPEDFDLVIFHQLPAKGKSIAHLLPALDKARRSRIFVLGAQSDVPAFNQVQQLLSISGGGGADWNEVQALPNPSFAAFTVDEALGKELPNFPPLAAPFGQYEAKPDARVLLHQKIGSVKTEYPLWLMGEEGDHRTAILAGEGFWRWKLFDYLQFQNFDLVSELFLKTVQYSALKDDKRRFRVSLQKQLFSENEPILFDARLYNENYEAVNEPEAALVITDAEGHKYEYVFDKTDHAYRLNAGILPVGAYTYEASVEQEGQRLSYSGRFSVEPLQLELYDLTARHGILRLLAGRSGGAFFRPDELAKIPARLDSLSTLKPVLHHSTRTREAIHLKWIFFLLLALFSLEWFLRRFWGSY